MYRAYSPTENMVATAPY